MNNLNNRDLESIRFTSNKTLYVPKVGNLGPTLVANGPNKDLAKIVSMKKVDGGVYLEVIASTGPHKGKQIETFIPNTQFEILEFKKDETNSKAEAGNSES